MSNPLLAQPLVDSADGRLQIAFQDGVALGAYSRDLDDRRAHTRDFVSRNRSL